MKTSIKTIFTIGAALSLTACASTSPAKQVIKQVQTSSVQSHSFCNGEPLKSYIETDYYYQFACSDGRFFMLPKR